MSLKNPVTPPGIDPGTVRLVAQRLNHYATPGPACTSIWKPNMLPYLSTMYLRPNGIGSSVSHAVDPVYNDTALVDTSLLASDNLWYQLIVHC
jgi:hypothetical protein